MNQPTTTPIQGSGIQWAIGQIMENHFKLPLKKPKAVKTDPGVPARCYQCRGDGCGTCCGDGDLPNLQSVDIMIYRGFDEVPVQVSIRDGKVLDAWCVRAIGEPGEVPRYSEGTDVALLPEEEATALEVLR